MRSGRALHPQSPWSGKSPILLPRRPRSCRLHTDEWVGELLSLNPSKFTIDSNIGAIKAIFRFPPIFSATAGDAGKSIESRISRLFLKWVATYPVFAAARQDTENFVGGAAAVFVGDGCNTGKNAEKKRPRRCAGAAGRNGKPSLSVKPHPPSLSSSRGARFCRRRPGQRFDSVDESFHPPAHPAADLVRQPFPRIPDGFVHAAQRVRRRRIFR